MHAQGYGCRTSTSVMSGATLSLVFSSSIVEHVKEQARILITLRCRKAKKDIAEVEKRLDNFLDETGVFENEKNPPSHLRHDASTMSNVCLWLP